MTDFLFAVPAFLLAIFILVGIHEFGHFWVARRCGVKVTRFSIGMGKVVWSRTAKDGVEYTLSALPIGGYVSMVGHGTEFAEEDADGAFDNKSVFARFAIVAAGPAINIALAVVLYWCTFVMGVPGIHSVVGDLPQDGPFATAGVESGERIVGVNGKLVNTWEEAHMGLISALYEDSQLELSLVSGDTVGTPSAELVASARNVVVPLKNYSPEPSQLMDALGLTMWRPSLPAVVGQVVPDSAAQLAGFEAQDRILALDSVPVSNWTELVELIQERANKSCLVDIERQGQRLTLTLIPKAKTTPDGRVLGFAGVGPHVSDDFRARLERHRAETSYSVFGAIPKAIEKTWSTTTLTFAFFGKMLSGQVSVKNIGGPIQIADIAGQAAQAGLVFYLGILAMVSLNLGILNLLPVPVLDGGHLLYYVVEMVKGSPVSERVQIVGQKIGLALLLCLMTVAFYNDITRLL
jgi:regulator of sigma E protease